MLICDHTTEDLFAGTTPVYSSSVALQGAHFAIQDIDLAATEMEERPSQHFHIALWNSCATGEHASRRGYLQRFIKPQGSLTFVPPGLIPAARTDNANRLTWCVISRRFVSSLSEECGMTSASFTEKTGFVDARIRNLLELLLIEAATHAESGPLYTDQLATALAIRVLALGANDSRQEPRTSALRGGPLRNVLEMIQSSGGQIALETLAKEAGFSQRHFLRMFQQAMGLTPYAYALKIKLSRVQQLMLDKRLSLVDIALSAGFSSHSHLTRTFKAHFGVSPSRFRRTL